MTLGCARNEVDSEEMAARLMSQGWDIAEADEQADVVVVNTCGFVTAAKQESIDVLLSLSDDPVPAVAVGCLAERYGEQLQRQLPEAAAVIGFDSYDTIGDTLRRVVAGENIPSHQPRDRRTLLPLAPVQRPGGQTPPGHGQPAGLDLPGADARVLRSRLHGGPVAPLKIASGCDRRCTFCAIPRFRGAFLSRHPDEIVTEARWLADQGVREVVLVSENSTSYGKDLGSPRLLESLLPALGEVAGIDRIRVSYLQPAEMRPGLVAAMIGTAAVADYFDLSFQHASGPLLRRMRRFGDADSFLGLIGDIRAGSPEAGIRSNVIVGFPGETEDDLAELERFLVAAELDAVGVFAYSPEDGTEAADLSGALDADEISSRVERICALADHVAADRASRRVGTTTTLLVTESDPSGSRGQAEYQGPQDGDLWIADCVDVGEAVSVRIVSAAGVDLIGEADSP